MTQDVKPKFDLQEIAGKFWGARWRILAFQALVFVFCIGVILYWPRTYVSKARLFLQLGREAIGIDPTATTGQMVGVLQSSREDEIISAMDVLKGRGMINQVVEKLSADVILGHVTTGKKKSSSIGTLVKGVIGPVLDLIKQIDPMSDFERAVIEVEQNMNVDAERKSEVIVIEYEADSPQLAQLVVDSIVKLYKEENVRLHRTEGSQTFFDEQQDFLAKALQSNHEALRQAKNRMGLASISGERSNLESRSREISQSMAETERNLMEVEARLSKLEAEILFQPNRIASQEVDKPNSATDQKSTQLYTLQLMEVEYKSRYAPGHPKLVAIRSQVEEAEKEYKKQSTKRPEMTQDINPIHRELSLDFLKSQTAKAGFEKKLETLKKQYSEILDRIREVNGFEIEISDLERDTNLQEKKYLTYSESLEQARISRALEANNISSVSVAQEATLQERPVNPSKPFVILFGGMAMMAGGLAIGMASVKFDDRLTTPLSVRNRLGVPLLATIPESRTLARSNFSK